MAKKYGRGCMFCGSPLRIAFVDLGMSPLCESYVSHEQMSQMEPFYPLHVYVCRSMTGDGCDGPSRSSEEAR